ncbi:hypothetical protein E5288_WYG001719 [Bos mutus]|uniref:EF-hand calcium-binding domain-containing protein 11 n=1 Tax=Bos mutus TaxID=72004 RepID=A0A6B0RR95_9CETA|nr:hypothetical protein [Bos mutus]
MAWKVKAGDSEDHIWEAFHVFDKDSKILVSTAKWRHAMTWLGKKLNNQEVEEMIRAAHMDADGQVNCEEFMHLLVSNAQFSRKPVSPIPDFQAGSGSFFPQKAPLELTLLNGGDDYPKGFGPWGLERTQT